MKKKLFYLLIIFLSCICNLESLATEFLHICNFDPRDDTHTDEHLFKISRDLNSKTDERFARSVNIFLSSSPNTLHNRIRILKNSTQFGASVFIKRTDYNDSLIITFNPGVLYKDKAYQTEQIHYMLFHALSHVSQNDFLITNRTAYTNWYMEINADKNAGALMARSYKDGVIVSSIGGLIDIHFESQNHSTLRPNETIRNMAATAGFLEEAMPTTIDQYLTQMGDGIPPNQMKKFAKEFLTLPENAEYRKQPMDLGSLIVNIDNQNLVFWSKNVTISDSSTLFIANKIHLKRPLNVSYNENDDDEEGDEEYDEESGYEESNNDWDSLLAKAPYYYQHFASRNKRGFEMQSFGLTTKSKLRLSRGPEGNGRLEFEQLTGNYYSLWENGDYFLGKNINAANGYYEGIFTNRKGKALKGKFDRDFKLLP